MAASDPAQPAQGTLVAREKSKLRKVLRRDGDIIELDTERRQVNVLVAPDELERRRQSLPATPRHFDRGYRAVFMEHILQADEGLRLRLPAGSTPAGTFAATRAV